MLIAVAILFSLSLCFLSPIKRKVKIVVNLQKLGTAVITSSHLLYHFISLKLLPL